MTTPRICARCNEPLRQRPREPTLDFRRRRTCGKDDCRWQGGSPGPRVRMEWPAWVDFSGHNHEPGDRGVVRLPGPEPRLGPGNSSLAE